MASAVVSPHEFAATLRDSIADCSTLFQEMVYIASYWNAETKLYAHPESGHVLPHSLAVIAGQIHTRTFEAWLSLPLIQQAAELSAYLTTLVPARRITLVRLLASESACEVLVPPTATAAERTLFCADLRAIVPSCADAIS